MDLALHLGGSSESLARSMTEAELQRWSVYVRRHALPFKRIELLLAQVSMLIAATMGGAKNVKLKDYMLKELEDELPANVTRIEDKRKAFGWNPHKKRKA